MSTQSQDWAWGQKIGSPRAKMILVALAFIADEAATVAGAGDTVPGGLPSYERLGQMTRLSIRTIRTHLKTLEQGGFLEPFALTADLRRAPRKESAK